MENKLKLGLIGLGERGYALLEIYLLYQKDVEIFYICDQYQDRVDRAYEKILAVKGDKPFKTTKFEDVLNSEIDAVIIATSWETHLQLAIKSLYAHKITGLEVGGACTIEECWKLVEAYESTKTPFMFLENCCYGIDELRCLKMARKGIFGEIIYCSGSYSHDLRDEITRGYINRHYRLDNYIKKNAENYPTHELGPIAKILDINRGNRIESLLSVSSESKGLKSYISRQDDIKNDFNGINFHQGDIVDTIMKCSNGETIRIQLDTCLPGFYNRALTIKGTCGMYTQSTNSVVIDGIDKTSGAEPKETLQKIFNNAERYNDLLPDLWQNISEDDKQKGHGGMDAILLRQFINCAKNNEEFAIDVYDAATWMSVSALSEISIATGNKLVEVPDFTAGKWLHRKSKDVL